ncbi:MAG: ECF transporter S component [Clostridia bacterium]|nr:ECF transporter S component [Clostridia bacterium]
MLKNGVKGLFFSKVMLYAPYTKRIAYVAVMTALLVVCNMFFEFKFADVQFSLTIAMSALAGALLGAGFGFVACFIGDLVGFLFNSGGFMYMPWIGIAMGMVAFIFGLLINGFDFKFKGSIYLQLGLASLLTFIVCTVGINTTAFWILYNTKAVPYFSYLSIRLFVSGQIWNSLLNYALCFVFIPLVLKLNIFETKTATEEKEEQTEE